MKEKLLKILSGTRSWKLVVHNNPDPDAIAAAYGFSYLLNKLGKRSKIYYKGIIGRAENKEMVKRLKINLQPIENNIFSKEMNIALFDSQPFSGNQPFQNRLFPKIVVDHHPLKSQTKKCEFYDVRENYGSSSTIIAEYLKEFEMEISEKVATAFYYGLKTDTFNFTRGFTKYDLNMLNLFIDKVSLNIIGKIENPVLPKDYYRKICVSIKNIKIFDKAVITDVGKINYPDISAEIADFLIRMNNVNWVMVFSYFNESLYFSIRTKSRQKIAGKLALYVVKNLGSGGGHENSAGGMVEVENYEDYSAIVGKLSKRFLKRLKLNTVEPTNIILDV